MKHKHKVYLKVHFYTNPFSLVYCLDYIFYHLIHYHKSVSFMVPVY